jgi:toxin-antitoxin system PIN domain toxin
VIFPDVNVLVYAYREDSKHFDICGPWLRRILERGEPIALSSQTLSSLIRIASSRRIYAPPSPVEHVIGFCEDLLSNDHCHVIAPAERHWNIFTSLLKETGTTGPMVTDAWLAALAIEWNCEFVTMDRDFSRFSKLRWKSPSD